RLRRGDASEGARGGRSCAGVLSAMSSGKAKPPAEIVARARLQIARIVEWTAGMDVASYTEDERTRYAVERAFIALGEAIKDLARAVDLQSLDPAGPWREPARFRDFLAHDYDDQVLPPLVWDTITTDLPDLDAALARVELVVAS
ncbi:MAG: HepT-like ribonuclease domain-containing protein, partial [Hyphomonadaceae bacterium]|nr:HepT-like ribonuclease domain-containing protein [Hyphomonadaceae bacterium]